MHIEKLTEEIEDWLEKADEEETLRFLGYPFKEKVDGVIIIELLGYYGAVAQTISKELHSISYNTSKLAGFFSTYFNEMIQFNLNDILLPVSIVKVEISGKTYILTSSNFPIPDIISYQLSEELWSFYSKLNPSKIVIIDGVHNYKRNIENIPCVHKIKSYESIVQLSKQSSSNFTMMGQSASSFLSYYFNPLKIPVEMLVADSFANYDPFAALEILKVLTDELKIDYKFEKLIQEVKKFQSSVQSSENQMTDIREELNSDTHFFL
jgi:predicted ATP-grasp superfamily ATP-dependent carboligase